MRTPTSRKSAMLSLRPFAGAPAILRLHRNVLDWYRHSGRRLPWRLNRTPYRILVSEVMLQQTQVSRVLQKFPVFLRRFPSLKHLARATRAGVIKAWQGMGYNRRAVHLHALAKEVTDRHAGKLPRSVAELQNLPGIGRYTAHAIACSAFQQAVPVVDTNITRVLARLFPAWKTDVWALAWKVLPSGKAYDWNQALMDLGATICTAARPRCNDCPVSRSCPNAFKIRPRPSGSQRKEPGREGIPNRIYRGRIVQILRTLNGKRSLSGSLVGRRIKSTFNRKDRTWLAGLLDGLKKDGLITLEKRKNEVLVSL